jgi:hypothetical protein
MVLKLIEMHVDHEVPCSIEVRNELSHVFTLPYAVLATLPLLFNEN